MSKISRTKRPLSIILSLLLIFSSVPLTLTAFAETEYTSDDGYLTYEVENGEATITDCDTTISGDYEIPSTLGGYSVTSIGISAFKNCTSLKSITIPDGVTSIYSNAFYGCTSLESIIIPDSVTSIYGDAFYGCTSLESVEIPDSVTSISGHMFYNCTSLISVTIPDSVISIDSYAFSGCASLESITIPDSVTSIGDYAFYNTAYYNDEANWEGRILYIGSHLIDAQAWAISGSYEIKEGTKTIADKAFSKCTHLTGITIPESVTTIGNYAFDGCKSLTSVTIGNGVTTIGNGAFRDCTSLESIEIPESVTTIGNYAFDGCTSLESINIPDSVTSIGSYAFGNTAYYNDDANWEDEVLYIDNWLIAAQTSISGNYEIKDGTNGIASNAFEDCTYLEGVTIPDSVTIISAFAFYNCTSLTSVIIPDSVTSLGYYAFYNCASLESAIIGNGITSIGVYAFFSCTSLESITIPDSVTTIDSGAFYFCTSLASVTIGENVQSILLDDIVSEFIYCPLIESFTVSESNEYYSTDEYGVLYNKDKTKLIQFPAGSGITSYTIPDSVTTIDAYAFINCTSLTDVIVPASVTEINEGAFGIAPEYIYDENNLVVDTEWSGIIEDLTLYGYAGTAVEMYAYENDITFVALEDDIEPEDPAESCSHFCHSESSFIQFFYKIIRFFWKIFGINQYCECGAAHY